MGLSRPPWSVKDHAPAWWEPRPKDLEAIGSFDRRHHGHHARANRMTREVARDSTSLSKSQALGVAIWELGHNRYFLVEALEEARRYEKRVKPRKKKVWKLVDSIWSARRKAGDAKDFYDTPHVKQSAFYCDWNLGVERMKLDKKAERAAKVGIGAEAAATAKTELRQGMEEHKDIVRQTFDYYGHMGNDIFSVTVGSYLQFVRDAGLVNEDVEGQRSQDLQLVFDSANASATKEDVFNSKRNLNRMEWLGVLSQLVLERHVKGGGLDPVEACRKFFREDVLPKVPKQCFQDSNSFRADFCYTEAADMALKKHEDTLRNLFASFAYGTGAIGDALYSTKLMDAGEFNEFIQRIDVIDNNITQREVRLAFLWSRMLVVDENTLKGRTHVLQLRFEDFLEMVVRLAYMMAMPTEEDLEAAGVVHAGEYLQWLSGYPEEEKQFKRARCRAIGEPLDQPLEEKLRHFLDWLVFTVHGGDGLDAVTRKDADKFRAGHVAKLRREAADADGEKLDVFARGVGEEGEEEEEEVGYMRKAESGPQELARDSAYRSSTTLEAASDDDRAPEPSDDAEA